MEDIYLLVISQEVFYDAHGCPDKTQEIGKSVDYIEDGDWKANGYYLYLEDGVITPYKEDVWYEYDEAYYGFSTPVTEELSRSSCDGYNCSRMRYKIKIITKEEYDRYSSIIEAYDSIPV